MTAEEWYNKGNEFRQRQNWREAINCYTEAIELDKNSPAVHTRKMILDILEFYNKDMYNP